MQTIDPARDPWAAVRPKSAARARRRYAARILHEQAALAIAALIPPETIPQDALPAWRREQHNLIRILSPAHAPAPAQERVSGTAARID